MIMTDRTVSSICLTAAVLAAGAVAACAGTGVDEATGSTQQAGMIANGMIANGMIANGMIANGMIANGLTAGSLSSQNQAGPRRSRSERRPGARVCLVHRRLCFQLDADVRLLVDRLNRCRARRIVSWQPRPRALLGQRTAGRRRARMGLGVPRRARQRVRCPRQPVLARRESRADGEPGGAVGLQHP